MNLLESSRSEAFPWGDEPEAEMTSIQAGNFPHSSSDFPLRRSEESKWRRLLIEQSKNWKHWICFNSTRSNIDAHVFIKIWPSHLWSFHGKYHFDLFRITATWYVLAICPKLRPLPKVLPYCIDKCIHIQGFQCCSASSVYVLLKLTDDPMMSIYHAI